MDITAEISLYPFNEGFKDQVKEFITKLEKDNPGLLININAMSTRIAGPYDDVMELVNVEIKDFLTSNEAVFVLKIARGCRIEENGNG